MAHLHRKVGMQLLESSMVLFRGKFNVMLLALYRLIGARGCLLVGTSVPAGVILGATEIVTASVLYAVLAEFNLVSGRPIVPAVTLGTNPIVSLFGLTVLAALVRYANQVLPVLSDLAFTGRLREALVRSTLGGVSDRSVMSVSETSHILSDVVARGAECVKASGALAAAFCMLCLVLIGLFRMSWQLAAMAIGFGGRLAILLVMLRRSYGKYVTLIHPFLRKFNNGMVRAVRNHYLLQISGFNDREADMLIQMSRNSLSASKNYMLLFILSGSIAAPAAVFVVIGFFWLNVSFTFLPTEALVPLVYLLSRTGNAVSELSMSAAPLQRNWPYIIELLGLAEHLFPENEVTIPSGDTPPQFLPLEVKSLRFGRTVALTPSVNVTAGKGDFVLVSGPSGRGKTTFIMTLIGLIHPIGGAIYWGGMPIDRIDAKRLRRRARLRWTGTVFDRLRYSNEPALWPRSSSDRGCGFCTHFAPCQSRLCVRSARWPRSSSG